VEGRTETGGHSSTQLTFLSKLHKLATGQTETKDTFEH